MTHDPLCPRASHPKICEGDGSACPTCQCELIAKVRADTLVKCVTAVKPLLLNVPETKVDQAHNEGVRRCMRALRGMRKSQDSSVT